MEPDRFTPKERAAIALLNDDMRRWIVDPRMARAVPAPLRGGISSRRFARLPVLTRVRILLSRQLLEETVSGLRPRRSSPPMTDASGRPVEPLPTGEPLDLE